MTRLINRGLFSLFFLLTTVAFASEQNELDAYLQKFQKNPELFMNSLPAYVDDQGNVIERGKVDYPETSEEIDQFYDRIKEKMSIHQNSSLGALDVETFAAPGPYDRYQHFIENSNDIDTNVFTLNRKGLMRGKVNSVPWSDSYWPDYLGGISNRFADSKYPKSSDWKINYQFVQDNPAENYIPDNINQLSPAEKYDLLIGAKSNGLAASQWVRGQKTYNRMGYVPSWHGYCDGWAAASHFGIEAPLEPVTLTGVQGHEITFYPSDIKALVTMLWMRNMPQTIFAGSRCNISNPEKDENGRIIDQKCFDSNPLAWHMILTHRIGKEGQSFVFDNNYDYEVWNFPITSYSAKYFNPKSMLSQNRLNDAIVELAKFPEDRFAKYRSPDARYVVGITMDITHPVSTLPHTRVHGAPVTSTVRFVYDLELDRNYNIIGGEWYQNAHPDFLWSFPKGSQAVRHVDHRLSLPNAWDVNEPFPVTWSAPANSQAYLGRPLPTIVETILDASRGNVRVPTDSGDAIIADEQAM